MRLFKVKKRKVWHIARKSSGSVCNSASTHDPKVSSNIANHVFEGKALEFKGRFKEYTSQPDYDYIDIIEVDEIPHEIHDSFCKACVQRGFEAGIVRIIANK